MNAETAAPRWVVVTRPDRPGLLNELAWRYRLVPWVSVLADRRRGERRQRQDPCAIDLRLGERRAVPGDHTLRPSHRLAHQGGGFDVYEATGHAVARCPACGATIVFEMPRSGVPPTRLDLEVAHDPMAVVQHRARHLVDLFIYASSDRPLLAWRTFARTRVEGVEAS
jgi:hypothetical protein